MVSEHDWEECPRGLLAQLVERHHVQQGRERARRTLGAVAVAACLVLVVGVVAQVRSNSGSINQITCGRATELFVQYNSGTLSATSHAEVEHHLEECPNCREKYRESFPEVLQAPSRLVALLE